MKFKFSCATANFSHVRSSRSTEAGISTNATMRTSCIVIKHLAKSNSTEEQGTFWDGLEKSLAKCCIHGSSHRPNAELHPELIMDLVYDPAQTDMTRSGYIIVRDLELYGFFSRLMDILESDANFDIDMKLALKASTGPENSNVQSESYQVILNDMDKQTNVHTDTNTSGHAPFKLAKFFNFSKSFAENWKSNNMSNITGNVSIYVRSNEETLNLVYLKGLPEKPSISELVLNNAKESGDVLIVNGKGDEVYCHKAFLLVRLDTLKNVLNGDAQASAETQTICKLEMNDLSTLASIQAFLDYVYCWNLQKAVSNSRVAVDLLVVADKYKLKSLYTDMRELILIKPDTWFSSDAAIKLMRFGVYKETCDKGDASWIKNKVKSVFNAVPYEDLRKCQEMEQVSNKPTDAIDIFSYVLSDK